MRSFAVPSIDLGVLANPLAGPIFAVLISLTSYRGQLWLLMVFGLLPGGVGRRASKMRADLLRYLTQRPRRALWGQKAPQGGIDHRLPSRPRGEASDQQPDRG
jgi:hypothetical protein